MAIAAGVHLGPYEIVAAIGAGGMGEVYEDGGAFSPDGHWLAFSSNESGQFQVYVQPFPPTGAKHPISGNGGAPAGLAQRRPRTVLHDAGRDDDGRLD